MIWRTHIEFECRAYARQTQNPADYFDRVSQRFKAAGVQAHFGDIETMYFPVEAEALLLANKEGLILGEYGGCQNYIIRQMIVSVFSGFEIGKEDTFVESVLAKVGHHFTGVRVVRNLFTDREPY